MSIWFSCDRCGCIITRDANAQGLISLCREPDNRCVCVDCYRFYQSMTEAEAIRVQRIVDANRAAYWSHPRALRSVEA